jgi:hypothetical protein
MWNIFQFKSHSETYNGAGSDPFWIVELTRKPLRFTLKWKGGASKHATGVSGPQAGGSASKKTWHSQIPVPVRRWFHLEAFLVQSGGFAGKLTVWVDGSRLWRFPNVRTKWPDGDQRWSINNYSNGVLPSVTTLYVDDAAISTKRMGDQEVTEGT